MPITTHRDSVRGLRYHVVTQTLRLDEFRETLQAVLDLAGLEPEMDELWDLRDLRPDHPVLGVEELKALVYSCGRLWARTTKARAAIVVSRTIDYGMARMGEILVELRARRLPEWREPKASSGRTTLLFKGVPRPAHRDGFAFVLKTCSPGNIF